MASRHSNRVVAQAFEARSSPILTPPVRKEFAFIVSSLKGPWHYGAPFSEVHILSPGSHSGLLFVPWSLCPPLNKLRQDTLSTVKKMDRIHYSWFTLRDRNSLKWSILRDEIGRWPKGPLYESHSPGTRADSDQRDQHVNPHAELDFIIFLNAS